MAGKEDSKQDEGPPDPPRGRRIILLLVILVVGIGLDQWTKQLARDHLQGRPPISYLGGSVKLVFALNTGAFLGLGGSMSPWARWIMFIAVNTVFLTGVVAYMVWAHKLSRVELHSLAWVVSGGIGNLIDRVQTGAVTDFINLGIGSRAWPRTGIFNVADIAITVGVVVLFIAGFFADKKDKDEKKK